LKKKALVEANKVLIDEKKKNREFEMHEQSLERNTHFPYTHGDLVEKQRVVLTEL